MAADAPKPKGMFGVVRGSEGIARLASTVLVVVIVELVLARHTVLVFVSATLIDETALTHTTLLLLPLSTAEYFVLDGAAVRFVEIFNKSHGIDFGGDVGEEG